MSVQLTGKGPRVAVMGLGVVGLATAVALAGRGCRVVAIERDRGVRERVIHDRGIYGEPRLGQMAGECLDGGSMTVEGHNVNMAGCAYVFICVGTPHDKVHGGLDTSQVHTAVDACRTHADRGAVIVLRSTVPVGTCDDIERLMSGPDSFPGKGLKLVFCPEFMSAGSAVDDALRPPRVVAGCADYFAGLAVLGLFFDGAAGHRVTGFREAEMSKLAINTALAAKVSLANTLSMLCGRLGVDARTVMDIVRSDTRIGAGHMRPGLGYGGSCFPKDLDELANQAGDAEMDPEAGLLQSVAAVNRAAWQWPLGVLSGVTRVALLGLSFKTHTSDIRNSPAILLALRLLIRMDVSIRAYDPSPKALAEAEVAVAEPQRFTTFLDPYGALKGCEALVACTDHAEFGSLDLGRAAGCMDGHLIVDGRHMIDPARAQAAGFDYTAPGHGRTDPFGCHPDA